MVPTLKKQKITGNISEVFASIQGEGLFIGTMQLFVRLAGCSLKCRRCELPEYQQNPESFYIRPWPGLRSHRMANPVTPGKLMQKIDSLYRFEDFFCVSILGGEPLEQPDFLAELLPHFIKRGIPVFIETSGLLPDEFIRLYDLFSYWCVDLKISRSWGFNGKLRRKHEKIIAKADPRSTYFRILVDANDDSEAILEQIRGLNFSRFNLVVQPFAYAPSHFNDWDTNTILEWINLFRPFFREVRWVPQVHKLLRII